MGMNVIVQNNGGFLPDILLFTKPLLLYGSMALLSYIITTLLIMYYIVFCFVLFGVPACMAINVSVQYSGGLLPDIILLTQGYYHRGIRLNAMKRFCICSL